MFKQKLVWLKKKCRCNVKYFLLERTSVNHVFIIFFQFIVLVLVVPLERMTAKCEIIENACDLVSKVAVRN